MSKIIILFISYLIFSLSAFHCKRIGVNKDDFPPDFTLTDLLNRQYTLSHFSGKQTLLYFWADCCTGDSIIFRKTENAYMKLHKNGIELLTINVGNSDILRKRTEGININFPILLDDNAAIAKLYRVHILPTLFIISKDGKIENVLIGWENKEYMQKIYVN